MAPSPVTSRGRGSRRVGSRRSAPRWSRLGAAWGAATLGCGTPGKGWSGGQVAVTAAVVVVVRGDMNQLVVSKGKRTGEARIGEVEKAVMLGFRLVSRDIFRVRV